MGVVLMCLVDVLLLVSSAGQPAAALIGNAAARLHGPAFNSATIGPVTDDFPDLVLAAVVGGYVAGHPFQHRSAVALTVLAAASGMLLPFIPLVPETVPIGLTFVLVGGWERARRGGDHTGLGDKTRTGVTPRSRRVAASAGPLLDAALQGSQLTLPASPGTVTS